jgi:hypothetical protein
VKILSLSISKNKFGTELASNVKSEIKKFCSRMDLDGIYGHNTSTSTYLLKVKEVIVLLDKNDLLEESNSTNSKYLKLEIDIAPKILLSEKSKSFFSFPSNSGPEFNGNFNLSIDAEVVKNSKVKVRIDLEEIFKSIENCAISVNPYGN